MKILSAASLRGWSSTIVGALILVVGASTAAVAQEPRPGTSRAELEAAADELERELASGRLNELEREEKRAEAQAIRERLRDGDIMVGDRIAMRVRGYEALTDTFIVRAGRTLHLPELPEISLAGVLRSELPEYLTIHLSRYLRDPVIEVVPLVRLGVMGPVGRPGYYALPADMLLSDVIMYAGGPTGGADMQRSSIKRGRQDVITRRGFSRALMAGMTLDELNVRAGDELVIGERIRRNWQTTIRTVGYALGIALTLGLITR